MATKKKTEPATPSTPKKADTHSADALAKGASDTVKQCIDDPGFVLEQVSALSTDDFVILKDATPSRISDIAYMALHSKDATLKQHAQRVITNLPLYQQP